MQCKRENANRCHGLTSPLGWHYSAFTVIQTYCDCRTECSYDRLHVLPVSVGGTPTGLAWFRVRGSHFGSGGVPPSESM